MIKFSEKYLKWNKVFLLILFILLFFSILSCYSKKQVKSKDKNLINDNRRVPGKKFWDTVRIVHEHREPITKADSIEMVMKNMKMSIQRYLYFTEDSINYNIKVDSLYDLGFRPDIKLLDSVMKMYYYKKRK